MGLARPEGAALAVFLALSLLPLVGAQHRAPIAMRFALTFVLFGSVYFTWHWRHFGYPLPDPFYVRSIDPGHLRALRDAIKSALWLLLPLAPAFALHLWKGQGRVTLTLALPVAGFVALWFAISHGMNFLLRYQYPLVPLVLVTWAPTTGRLADAIGPSLRRAALSASALIAMGVVLRFHRASFPETVAGLGDDRRNVGLALSKFSHDYTLVTSEAGQLPLYSQWRTVDAGGLNDSWIAHHGLSAEYLDQNHPAVIVTASFPYASTRWREMAACLEDYASAKRYVRASPTTLPFSLEFYVAPWVPESSAIVESIEKADQAGAAP